MSQRSLDKVYAAKTAEQLSRAYAEWAADYDRDTIALGYCLPFLVTSWIARHVAADAGTLLDAGCGTGLSGPALAALGYRDIVGLDYSQQMLDIAAFRGSYGELTQAELGKALPWPDGRFAGFLSAGVFTAGHAPASGLRELVRVTRAGGHAAFTVRDILLDEAGFRTAFEELETRRRWQKVEESEPFRAFVLAEPEVLVKAFVFKIL